MHLRDRPAIRKVPSEQVDLAFDVIEIPLLHVPMRRDDDVAAAVGAALGAERQMDIER